MNPRRKLPQTSEPANAPYPDKIALWLSIIAGLTVSLIMILIEFVSGFLGKMQAVNFSLFVIAVLLLLALLKYQHLLSERVPARKKQSSRKVLFTIDRTLAVIGVFFGVVGIVSGYFWYNSGVETSIRLSEQSLNDTFWLTSPVNLQVNQSSNDSAGRLEIDVKNIHPTRGTGRIYLYKIEINPDKPEMINVSGLAPGESMHFSLTYVETDANVSFGSQKTPYGGFGASIPADKMYYITAHNSITYRITCDNCPSQGYMGRLPEFSAIRAQLSVNYSNRSIVAVSMPTYRWVDYQLSDIEINGTK